MKKEAEGSSSKKRELKGTLAKLMKDALAKMGAERSSSKREQKEALARKGAVKLVRTLKETFVKAERSSSKKAERSSKERELKEALMEKGAEGSSSENES